MKKKSACFEAQPSWGSTVKAFDDDDSISSEDSDPNFNVISTGERATLQAGDVIEYYHPIVVVGDPYWHRMVMIVGINPPLGRGAPLIMRNGDVLDLLTRVKRIGRYLDGKIVSEPNRGFMVLEDYHLQKSDCMDAIAIDKMEMEAKKQRKERQESIWNFWKQPQESNEAVESNSYKL